MSAPSFLLVCFDVDKIQVPHNAIHQYIEKRTWQTLQDEIVKTVEIGEDKYAIKNVSSFKMGDITGATMVLVLHIKKLTNLKPDGGQ